MIISPSLPLLLFLDLLAPLPLAQPLSLPRPLQLLLPLLLLLVLLLVLMLLRLLLLLVLFLLQLPLLLLLLLLTLPLALLLATSLRGWVLPTQMPVYRCGSTIRNLMRLWCSCWVLRVYGLGGRHTFVPVVPGPRHGVQG